MRAGVLLVGVVLLNAGCGGSAPPAPVYLGHVATLSGPDKYAGDQAARGIRLAVQEQNARAKTQNERPFVVRHTDTQGRLDAFEGEAVRLVAVNKIVTLFGGATVEEVVRLDRGRAPILTPIGHKTASMSDLVFCSGLSPAYQGRVLARFVGEQWKPERVTVLIDDRETEATVVGDSVVRELSKMKAPDGKGPLRVLARRLGKGTDLKEQAKSVDEDKPQVLVYAGVPRDFSTLRRALSTRPALVFAGEEGSARTLLDAGELQDIYLVSAFAADVDTERGKTFSTEFRKAFSAEPDVHAALAYDAVRLFEDAFKRCEDKPTTERFKKEIVEIKDFAGLTGPLAFAADGRLRRPAFVLHIDRGQIKTQKKFAPEE